MSKSPKRIRQVADVIRHQVAYILKKDVRDPRLATVSITSVNVSPDLSNARVYFTLSEVKDLAQVEKAFKKGTAYLRRQLAENIEMRYVPQLTFVYDKSFERGSRISSLIDDVMTKDRQNKSDDDSTDQN